MSNVIHYFFFDQEIIILKVISSMNLAKVRYISGSELFFVDINFISKKYKCQEPSLSLEVLGGIVYNE